MSRFGVAASRHAVRKHVLDGATPGRALCGCAVEEVLESVLPMCGACVPQAEVCWGDGLEEVWQLCRILDDRYNGERYRRA